MKMKFWKSLSGVIIISSLFFCSVSSTAESENNDYLIQNIYQEPGLLPTQNIIVSKLFKKTLTLQDGANGGSGIKNNVSVSLEGSLAKLFFTNIRYSEEKKGEHSRYGYVDIEGIPSVEGEVNVSISYEDGAGNATSYILPIQAKFSPASPVTIRYIDTEGLDLHSPKLISGNVGDNYDSSTDEYKLAIEGYALDESQLPQNALGILGEEAQTVTYVYDKIPTKAQDVKILYLNREGVEIHTPQLISGNVGDSYDGSTDEYKLSIEGYKIDESQLPQNALGILSEEAQIVTYVYDKIPTKAQDVRIVYLNYEGTEIHSPKVISGNIGNAYNVSTDEYKLVIKGYVLDESRLPENALGLLSEEQQTVTYVYKKMEITNGLVNQSTGKPFDDMDYKKKMSNSTKNLLPKTGEMKNSAYIIVGFSILSIVCFVIGYEQYVKKKMYFDK